MRLRNYMTLEKFRKTIWVLWQVYGCRMPFVITARFAEYGWCLLWRARKTFTLDGRHYLYALSMQNGCFRSERTVEIPIALHMFPLRGDILEIGNVLSNFVRFPHTVVDKYEKADGVQSVDIVDYSPGGLYDLIISISTFEHVGWDESPREPEKVLRAVHHTKTLLKPGGQLMVTLPLDYNSAVDAALRDGSFGFSRILYMERTSMHDWAQTTIDVAMTRKFDDPYPAANAIAVGLYGNVSDTIS